MSGNNDGSDGVGRPEHEGPTALQLQHQQFLGDASMVVLDFGSVRIDDNELLPEGITVEHLNMFETMYHAHCEVGCSHCMFETIYHAHCEVGCSHCMFETVV